MSEYKYQTPEFEYTEVTIKGEKKYYVEGMISTIDPDMSNEIVTMKAQEDILNAVQGRTITMDVEHQEFIDDGDVLDKPKNDKIPIAKIVEAKLTAKGVWAKAEINNNVKSFKSLWASIKGGFLHSFSIAFYPLKAIQKSINGIEHKFIEALNLINVTLTGCPVNTYATFAPVMKAALKGIEESNMTEENKEVKEEPVVEEPKVEPAPVVEEKKEEPVVEAKKEAPAYESKLDELTKMIKDQNTQIAELKDKLTPPPEPEAPAIPDSALEGPLSTLKSNSVEIAKLKAELNKPIMKGMPIEDTPKVGMADNKENPLDKIC